MIKEYSQNRSNVIMNFTGKYCKTPQELLESVGFKKVLKKYIQKLSKSDALLLDKIAVLSPISDFNTTFIELFKLLIILDTQEIEKLNDSYKVLLNNSDILIEFVEGFYNYWRGLERYALILTTEESSGIQNVSFIEANNNFTNLILAVYRRIEENILGYSHNVYRQLSAGINAGLVLTVSGNILPVEYNKLNRVQFIKQIILTPPFIVYPKKNTRSGFFNEVKYNPIVDLPINDSHFFCFPAKIGESLAFVYFHRDFMNHGVSLCNLFELAKAEDIKGKKPDLIFVFGAKNVSGEKETVFYHDQANDIYTGYVSNCDEIDYFGYMKKMILTLHNVRMINLKHLPIHGAMVNVTLKNGKSANIAIVGDSGAGKSESLEAFRKLSNKYLKEMKIIFDDMGSFKIENNRVIGYGTEIGAFVRLDDLEMGYSFKEMDRAIFMNPHRVNARLLLPVSSYETIMKGYEVDVLLYANNYEDSDISLVLFDNIEKAKKTFIEGKRKAKGTTTESGLVTSYFANPFGPVQRQNQNNQIIDEVFNLLYSNKVRIGQIYTKLAISGQEQRGPEKAALELFKLI